MPNYCVFCWAQNAFSCKPIGDWKLRNFQIPPGFIDAFSHESCARIEAIKQLRRKRLEPLPLSMEPCQLITGKYMQSPSTASFEAVALPDELYLTQASDSNFDSDAAIPFALNSNTFPPRVHHQIIHSLILDARQAGGNGCISDKMPSCLPHAPSLYRDTSKEEHSALFNHHSPLRMLVYADLHSEKLLEQGSSSGSSHQIVCPKAQVKRPLNPKAIPFYCPLALKT